MVNPEDYRAGVEGFSTACTGMIAFTKILTIGLSLGTGICGGHFWGPLYVGCAASHFFTDIMARLAQDRGFSFAHAVSAFPCVAMLCIMGSTHVVTYRCHMAIMLVLTLTISSFMSQEKSGSTTGDYSAIFPLLVVACFVPLMLARDTIFYAKQRCRGDIVAIPEVLCEPMREGTTAAYIHGYDDDSYSSYDSESEMDSGMSMGESAEHGGNDVTRQASVTTAGTDNNFNSIRSRRSSSSVVADPLVADPLAVSLHSRSADPLAESMHSIGNNSTSLKSLGNNSTSIRCSSRGRSSSREGAKFGRRPSPSLTRVSSFGHVVDLQPTLLGQARDRASTTMSASRSNTPVNVPAIPRGHRRKGSNISMRSGEISDPMDFSRHSHIGDV